MEKVCVSLAPLCTTPRACISRAACVTTGVCVCVCVCMCLFVCVFPSVVCLCLVCDNSLFSVIPSGESRVSANQRETMPVVGWPSTDTFRFGPSFIPPARQKVEVRYPPIRTLVRIPTDGVCVVSFPLVLKRLPRYPADQ